MVGKSNNEKQTSSRLAFFTHIIDYAGLFPPSQLAITDAIRNYAAYQTDDDHWMLGNFVIPVNRLDELSPFVSLFTEKQPLPISVIGQKSTDAITCIDSLSDDIERISLFSKNHGEAVSIKVYELPLPPVVPGRKLLNSIAANFKKNHIQIFCEITVPLNNKQQVVNTIDEIAQYNKNSDTILGLKLRTGGLTADAFPTPDQVATVLVRCSQHDIPLKFTAGLHHPIRMYRDEVKTYMHGFLNVFIAGMLARNREFDHGTILEVLEDKNEANFSFTEQGFSWKDKLITISEIKELRKHALCSFGSCSFDEPREDLRILKIIK